MVSLQADRKNSQKQQFLPKSSIPYKIWVPWRACVDVFFESVKNYSQQNTITFICYLMTTHTLQNKLDYFKSVNVPYFILLTCERTVT